MKPKWVLEKNVFEDNIEDLISTLQKKDIEYKILDLFDFEMGKHNYKDIYPENDCVICYTSINFMKRLQRETRLWVPHSYCNFSEYRCSNYYPYFWEYLLNRGHIFIPFGLLRKKKEQIFRMFGDKIFLRPNSGDKIFAGQVIRKDQFDHFIESEKQCSLIDENEMVLINRACELKSEWRFIVCKNKVITGSTYSGVDRYSGELITHGSAWDFAQKMVDEIEYKPDNVFTIDICQCGSSYYVLEINSFSTSGLYKCDLDITIDKITELALEDWKEVFEE